MRIELPLCTRCCFCLPLRFGLIAWGYLNLFVGILMTSGSIFLLNKFILHVSQPEPPEVRPKNAWVVLICLILTVGIVEIVLSLIFIIGCHKKNLKLLKTFYFYIIALTVISTTLQLYSCVSTLTSTLTDENIGERHLSHFIYFPMLDFGLLFAHLGIQVYMLLVLRTEILKLSNDCQFRFSNIGGEAECTLTSEIMNKEKDSINN